VHESDDETEVESISAIGELREVAAGSPHAGAPAGQHR
jgi:hypothetical protein